MLQTTIVRRLAYGALVIFLLILLGFRVQRWFWGENGLFTNGQGDFEMYRVPTVEMLKGNNPYRLVLDGKISDIPGNAPLFLVTLIPYVLFDQGTARILWWMTNLFSAIGVAGIMELKFLPNPFKASRFLLILTLFLVLSPTSSAIQIGQTSIVVFFLALLGLAMLPRSQILSGVLFGLAFSKYSLVFLLIPYLLIDRHFRSLFVAALTQLGGILIMSYLVSVNPFQLTVDYLTLVRQYTTSPTELNLHSRLVEFGVSVPNASAVSIVGIAVTVLVVVRYMIMDRTRTTFKDKVILIPLLFIGAIPFVYHRLYDGVVFILLIVSWLSFVNEPMSLGLRNQWPRRLAVVSGFVVLIALLYPRKLLDSAPALQEAGILFTTLSVLLVWLILVSVILMPIKTDP